MTSQTITLLPGDTVTIIAPATTTPPVQPPNPPIDPPPSPGTGPGCAGFTPSNVEVPWPTGSNVNQPLPFFGPNTALVVHFKVPANAVAGDTKQFNIQNTSGPNYTNVRMSLSNAAGCNTPTSYPPSPPVLWAAVSQTPEVKLSVGTTVSGRITVQPNTDYWITVVNRDGYPGNVSTTQPDAGTGRRFNFNN